MKINSSPRRRANFRTDHLSIRIAGGNISRFSVPHGVFRPKTKAHKMNMNMMRDVHPQPLQLIVNLSPMIIHRSSTGSQNPLTRSAYSSLKIMHLALHPSKHPADLSAKPACQRSSAGTSYILHRTPLLSWEAQVRDWTSQSGLPTLPGSRGKGHVQTPARTSQRPSG